MENAHKDIRQSAEHAEGRPLLKENTPSPHTRPAPSRVSACPRGYRAPGGQSIKVLGNPTPFLIFLIN
jgi:hypothetical protein